MVVHTDLVWHHLPSNSTMLTFFRTFCSVLSLPLQPLLPYYGDFLTWVISGPQATVRSGNDAPYGVSAPVPANVPDASPILDDHDTKVPAGVFTDDKGNLKVLAQTAYLQT